MLEPVLRIVGLGLALGLVWAARAAFNSGRRAEANRIPPADSQGAQWVRPGLTSWAIPIVFALLIPSAILVLRVTIDPSLPIWAALPFVAIGLSPVRWLVHVRARHSPEGIWVRAVRTGEQFASWGDLATVQFVPRRGGLELVTRDGRTMRVSMTLEGSEGLLRRLDQQVPQLVSQGATEQARNFIGKHAV